MERHVGYYRERSMDVMIGQLHWAVAAMLGLDQIIGDFSAGRLGLVKSNVAANAPKALGNVSAELCVHWQQRDLVWIQMDITERRNVLYYSILLFLNAALPFARKS